MRRAFSLIELSIVLVILGLLVGGILAGQSLIRSSELRSVTAEHDRFKTAIMTFKDKYFALPGDMANAQSFWGVETNCSPTSYATVDSTGTCNGGGNGVIGDDYGTSVENVRMWEHLSYAGLIDGQYTGKFSAAGWRLNAGTSVPASKLSGAVWISIYNLPYAGDTTYFQIVRPSNGLLFGKQSTSTPSAVPAILKPEEAWNIDTKIDDAAPATGTVQALYRTACTNSSSASDKTATYKLDVSTQVCGLNTSIY